MSTRQKFRGPLGSFAERQPDATDREMRTIISMALAELPAELRARLIKGKTRADFLDCEQARREIAEHLVVRLRRHIRCEHVIDTGARGGHG
ncbi:hypothetical protein [Jiella sp. M17.18]|uniref:hypothetical protein n=1 Tax=Jiella sp. M17.18 TaxID=3234247 RepID=UPI0034DE5E16